MILIKKRFMMKTINIKSLFSYFFIWIGLLATSCDSEFNDSSSIPRNTEPPKITSVSTAIEDEVVSQGVLENTYIIRGESLGSTLKIYFNGYQTSFNPALITDNVIFVTIPEEAPYVGQANILRVETLYGAAEYDFSLLTITGFTEETVNGVKLVHLMGGDFTDTESVTFVSGSEEAGNLVELEATIVSVSETLVTVEVPAGVEQAYIYLATTRGAVAQSESYGFSYAIYIDELNAEWSVDGWGGTQDLFSTEQALGLYSIKSVREGWSGLTFWAPNIPFNDYEAITVTIYGTGAPGDSVTLAINDFDGAASHQNLELVPGQWTKFVIPLSDFYPNGGTPDSIFRLDFQESSNTGLAQYIFYVDDFGFL